MNELMPPVERGLLLFLLALLVAVNLLARAQKVDNFDCDMVNLQRSRGNLPPTADSRRLDPILAADLKREKSLAEDITCFDPTMPKKITVIEGENALIPCLVSNVDFRDIKMSWWRENAAREISFGRQVFDPRFKLDIRGGNHWSLLLENALISDSGRYICQINSVQLKEKFIELKVERSRAQSVSLNDGVAVEPLSLDARSSGNPDYKFPSKNIEIIGNPVGRLDSPMTLTCKAKFADRGDSSNEDSLQWIAPSPLHTGPSQRSSRLLPRSSAALSTSRNTTVKWVNDTAFSVLTINRLGNEHAGRWKCRRYSRPIQETASANYGEPHVEESEVLVSVIPPESKSGQLFGNIFRFGGDPNGASSTIIRYHLLIFSIIFHLLAVPV